MFKGDSSSPSLVTPQKWSSEDEAYQCTWQEKGASAPRLQLSPERPYPGATTMREKGKCNIDLFLGRRCRRSHTKLVARRKGSVAYLQRASARRNAELREDASEREVTGLREQCHAAAPGHPSQAGYTCGGGTPCSSRPPQGGLLPLLLRLLPFLHEAPRLQAAH